MKKFFASLVAILAIGIAANAANYTIDESAIDAAIEAAVEVAPAAGNSATALLDLGLGTPDVLIAWLCNTFVGYFGIHRLYMGTSALTVVLYVITGGGLGIVDLIDWICMTIKLVNGEDCGSYANNTKFFMWL